MQQQHRQLHAEIKKRGSVTLTDRSFIDWYDLNLFTGDSKRAMHALATTLYDMSMMGHLSKSQIKIDGTNIKRNIYFAK